MFAVGHLSLGYIFGKISAKLLKTKLNLPLLLTVSVIPDIDVLLSPFIVHRTITHSLIFYFLISLPFFIIYLKKTTPYFIALVIHSLIGDIFSTGIQFFWPFSEKWIHISGFSTHNTTLELAFFISCIFLMIITKDLQKILLNKTNRIYWMIPLGAVLGPFFLNTEVYTRYPALLIIPSLIFITLFSYKLIFNSKYTKYN